jgi:HEPN domain-containing protein
MSNSKQGKPAKRHLKPSETVEEMVDNMVHTMTTQQFKQLVGYKDTAYKDYKAARVLFNLLCLQQACIFANTCIEKEIKACLLLHGVSSKSHDIFNLYNQLLRLLPNLNKELNRDFIKVISKIYESRYYENLNPGYNFVIMRNKFLAELDYTYSVLRALIGVQSSSKAYEEDLKNNNLQLYTSNYLLNGLSKADALAQSDFVLELRMLDSNQVVETNYCISHNPDEDFTYVALKKLSAQSMVGGVLSDQYEIALKDLQVELK